MIEQFQLFDKKGNLRSAEQSKANLLEAISAMETLGHSKTNKQLKTIKNLVGQLFVFFTQAQKVVEQLEKRLQTPAERLAFKAICRAYQCQKNYRKAKKAARKKYYQQEEQLGLAQAEQLLEQSTIDFASYKKQCYLQLDTIVQSSALVETINSIVRMYLNGAKNQTNQAQLNLIMFYHNHRRYVQGKRKNSTPMELLTGQQQDKDWLDLLLDKFNNRA